MARQSVHPLRHSLPPPSINPSAWNAGGSIPGLDGVRAIAVLLVIAFHVHLVSSGWIGVSIFFVLSGYLITRILVRERDRPLGSYVRNFYGRRFLRIFPVYYAYLLFLTVGVCLGGPIAALGAGDELPWAFTYTYDFYSTLKWAHHTPLLSHFWSLSVEEQFYLLWPFVIRICPRERRPALLWSLVLAGPLLRAATFLACTRLAFVQPNPFWNTYVLPLSHVDAFATGALLTLAPPRISIGRLVAFGASLFFVSFALWWRFRDGLLPLGLPHAYGYIWGYTLINAASAVFIALVLQGSQLARVCNVPLVAALGRVSYGAYVFHYPLALLTAPLTERLFQALMARRLAAFALDVGVAFPLAWVSYRLLEKPLLARKEHWFPLEQRTSRMQVGLGDPAS
jgi:peptidoglycan/LPS O-acetylase OafA/YrhL